MPTLFDPSNPPILDDEQYTYLIVIYSITGCGVLLNLVFLIILLSNLKKVLRASNLILNLNMSIADLFFYTQGLIVRYPLVAQRSYYKGTTNYVAIGSEMYFFGTYALFSVVLMSVERYTIIIQGKSTSNRRLLLSLLACMVAALFSSTLCLMILDTPYVYAHSGFYFSVNLGTHTPLGYVFTVFIISLQFVCLNIIFFCYFNIVKKVKTDLFKPIRRSFHSISDSTLRSNLVKTTSTIEANREPAFTLSQTNAISHSSSFVPITSHSSAMNPTMTRSAKRSRELELQIVRKAMAISFMHLFFWLPYITYCILALAGVNDLRRLDFFAVIGIELNSSVNATFSLLMDPKIQKFAYDLLVRLKLIKKRHKSHSDSN